MQKKITEKMAIFLFLLVYLIYFSFGFFHLAQFQTADEHLWIGERVHTYWHSLSPKDWIKTQLSDNPGSDKPSKPGVTVALISGIALFWEKNPQKDISNILEVESLYKSFRLPILFFNALFMFYIFWLIKKITANFWIAFWSFTLMLLSPILLGISQIVNPDSFLWLFSVATILTFIAYLETEEKKFLFLSPVMLGLSLLTKYVSTIFFPFLFLIFVLFCLLNIPKWKNEKIEVSQKILKFSFFYLLTFFGSLIVFSFFMPAVFMDKQIFLKGTVGYSSMKKIIPLILFTQFIIILDSILFKNFYIEKIFAFIRIHLKSLFKIIFLLLAISFLLVLINWNVGTPLLNKDSAIDYSLSEAIFNKNSPFVKNFLYQFFPLIFSLTPFTIVFILFFWIRQGLGKISHLFLSIAISSFIIIYYLALIVEKLPSTVRYAIVIYPLVLIIASLGIYEFFSHDKLKKINKIYISFAIIAISFISLWQIKPFYFSYINFLLPEKYILSGAWGYGGHEAAQYLNSLPNSKDIVVWADYGGFSKFFKGTTYRRYILKNEWKKVDYYVFSQQGKMMYDYWCNKRKNTCQRKYVPLNNFLETKTPVWELYIDDRPDNFIKIYKAE